MSFIDMKSALRVLIKVLIFDSASLSKSKISGQVTLQNQSLWQLIFIGTNSNRIKCSNFFS